MGQAIENQPFPRHTNFAISRVGEMDAATATALMSALGQPTRLMAVRRLLSAWPGTLPAGALARACRTGPSTFSRHLAILARTGVVQLERAGTTVHCRADAGRLRALLAYLSRDCCRDRSELCGAFAGIADLDEAGAHLPARQPARAAAPSRGPVPALNVLFLGSRNAARTILAEALLRRLGGARFNAYSAGARPARQPMPEVLGRLRRLGCDRATRRASTSSWCWASPAAAARGRASTRCSARRR
jgi:arsenate reductase